MYQSTRLYSKNPDVVIVFYMILQNDVRSPKSTRHSFPLTWSLSGGQDEIKTVELVIEAIPGKIDWNPRDKNKMGECDIYFFI